VGRLEPSKRFDRLIRAIREVPGTTLLLVGDGSARAALEQEAAARGVRSRVVFTGAVGHTRAALCAMDLFASPSEQETFGLAVLEALACGLPVVYAVCPPLDELAASGATGDAPRARRLSRDWEALARTLRAELAARSERGGARLPVPGVVGHYDITRLAASVGQLYERVANRPRRRAAFPHPLVESKGTRW
jgi:glycosyltransferase involved in cell wall biosynthesis